jgi:heme exporter protein D
MVSVLTLLAFVLSRKKVLEEVTEELQRAILEGVAGAVEELEKV